MLEKNLTRRRNRRTNRTRTLVEEAISTLPWTAILRFRATFRSGKRGERRMLMTYNPGGYDRKAL